MWCCLNASFPLLSSLTEVRINIVRPRGLFGGPARPSAPDSGVVSIWQDYEMSRRRISPSVHKFRTLRYLGAIRVCGVYLKRRLLEIQIRKSLTFATEPTDAFLEN